MRSIPVTVGALLLIFFAGCYTVLNHPAEVAMTEESFAAGDTLGDTQPCSACHYESEWLGFFDHELIYGWPGLLAVDQHDWWFDYYRRPWWWDGSWHDRTWYGSSDSGGDDSSSWRKRVLRRADEPSASAPSGVFPGGAPSTGSGATPASPTPDTTGGDKKPPEQEPAHRKKDPRR